jgi:hypothetical protein
LSLGRDSEGRSFVVFHSFPPQKYRGCALKRALQPPHTGVLSLAYVVLFILHYIGKVTKTNNAEYTKRKKLSGQTYEEADRWILRLEEANIGLHPCQLYDDDDITFDI